MSAGGTGEVGGKSLSHAAAAARLRHALRRARHPESVPLWAWNNTHPRQPHTPTPPKMTKNAAKIIKKYFNNNKML
jgi:hypothetical protein